MSATDFGVLQDFAVRNMYKAHLRKFVFRNNTISGVLYKDDPTIFGALRT